MHDFYYPYVGLDNLTTARSSQHRIGVYADSTFTWVTDASWDTQVNIETDALISDVRLTEKTLGISLHSNDFVDPEFNAFCRNIRLKNESSKKRDVKLFMHQVFEISRGGRGDTALYVPDNPYARL